MNKRLTKVPRKLSEEQSLKKRMRQAKRSLSEFKDDRSADKILYALSSAEADFRADIEQVEPRLLTQLWPEGIPDKISTLEMAYLTSVTPELSNDLHTYDPSLIYTTIGMDLLKNAEVAIKSNALTAADTLMGDIEAIVEHLTGEGKANKPKFWIARETKENQRKQAVSNARRSSVSKSKPFKLAQEKHAEIGKYVEDVRSLLKRHERASDNDTLQKHAVSALDRLIYNSREIQKLPPFERELNALISALDMTFEDGLERYYLYNTVKNYLKKT